MLLNRVSDLGRGRKPGVEHIGIDHAVALFQRLKILPDTFEESAAMKTAGGFFKGDIERPLDFRSHLSKRSGQIQGMTSQRFDFRLQNLVSDRSGPHEESDGLEAG